MAASLADQVAERLVQLERAVKKSAIQASLSGTGIARTHEALFQAAIEDVKRLISEHPSQKARP